MSSDDLFYFFKYGWHDNIHYFIVIEDELNLGFNNHYLKLSSNHLWICSIYTKVQMMLT